MCTLRQELAISIAFSPLRTCKTAGLSRIFC
jgi:hypothetical protein